MATIRERGPYQWQAQILRKGQSPQYKTFNNKADAEKWARQVEAEMDRGIFLPRKESENTTLSEALDRYEREVSSNKKSHEKEKVYIRQWNRTPLAKRFLATIQGKDIAAYRDARLNEVGTNAVRHELALLSHLFTIAVKEWGMGGLINPVQQVRKPPSPPGRERRLNPEEECALLAACEKYNAELSSIVRFALETAMRREEIAKMKWNVVDLKKRTVIVLDEKNPTGKSNRVVPLSSGALRILSGLPRMIDGKIWNSGKNYMTLAFIRVVSRARAAYEKECEEKGIKPDPAFLVDLTFHDLRHEATSRFFEKGLNPMQVAAITGHKTLQMLKRYTHLKAEDIALEIDRLEKERDRNAVENQVKISPESQIL
jgi:integrase